ncbi:MAG: hypothetical protein OEL76_17535, partial [Siculibacillus sp.]|nr:hypothetical protein [Siculibacillus sp.]
MNGDEGTNGGVEASEVAQRGAPVAPPPVGGAVGLVVDLAAMVRFYSRLPMPLLAAADDPARPPPFGRAIRMLPWASLLVAAPTAATLAAATPTALPSLVVAALALAV